MDAGEAGVTQLGLPVSPEDCVICEMVRDRTSEARHPLKLCLRQDARGHKFVQVDMRTCPKHQALYLIMNRVMAKVVT